MMKRIVSTTSTNLKWGIANHEGNSGDYAAVTFFRFLGTENEKFGAKICFS